MPPPLADLRDEKLFPWAISELPAEAKVDDVYYEQRDGQRRPVYTWCFLVEFTGRRDTKHLAFEVKDKTGERFSLVFQVYPHMVEGWSDLFRRGHTLAILYADRDENKRFWHRITVRQEELKNICVCFLVALARVTY